eukprot:8736106-Karenia_brevis.AAC.1
MGAGGALEFAKKIMSCTMRLRHLIVKRFEGTAGQWTLVRAATYMSMTVALLQVLLAVSWVKRATIAASDQRHFYQNLWSGILYSARCWHLELGLDRCLEDFVGDAEKNQEFRDCCLKTFVHMSFLGAEMAPEDDVPQEPLWLGP